MSEITLRHQDGETKYTITSSGFFLSDDGKLSLSVESDLRDDDDESPREIYFCVEDCEFRGVGEPIRVTDKHDWTEKDDGLHAFVYSGFHHDFVEVRLVVKSLTDDEMEIEFTIVTEDVEYYDERAEDSGIVGSCVLTACKKEDLWNPS
ncbi:MAG: hypothetical protein N2C14_02515 [Planctomycetales bacterium]